MEQPSPYDFSFDNFSDFCTGNNLTKETGIKIVLENINRFYDELKKLKGDLNR